MPGNLLIASAAGLTASSGDTELIRDLIMTVVRHERSSDPVLIPGGAADRTHVSTTGHVEEIREDADLADIDRLARQYTGQPYPQRDRGRISAWIAADGWYAWGALKDGGQPGRMNT